MLALTALVAAVAPALASPAPRTDLFVDAQANCAVADGSAAAPFCEIADALGVAAADDRILVAPGIYSGGLVVDVDVEIVGTMGEAVTIVEGAGLPNVVRIAPGTSASIEGLTLRGSSGRGLVVQGDLELRGSTVTGCLDGGVDVSGPASTLDADDVTIAENDEPGVGDPGAGLYVAADSAGATLRACRVVDNTQGFEGGGVFALADLTLRECVVSGNTAGVSGAGVMAFTGNLLIDSCLIHDNEATAFGAGLYARALASIEVVNTTISGNRLAFSFGGGAGVYVDSPPTAGRIVGCTIVGNSGAPGAGMLHLAPNVSLQASIVSGNSGPFASDIQGSPVAPIVSGGENVLGDTTDFVPFITDVVALDPLLDPLAWNGGPTRTHAPRAGSPCLGLSASNTLPFDQRGAARTGASVESGAFELIGAPAFCDGAPNSTLEGATLQASGNQVASNGAFSLNASRLPAQVFGFFLVGDGTQSVVPMNSQGTFCIGGDTGRFDRSQLSEIRLSDEAGRISLDVDLTNVPTSTGVEAIAAGDTRFFQLWYRDRNPGNTSNFSSAVGVTFE